MKTTLALATWVTLGCSIDWSLARLPSEPDPAGGAGGTAGATATTAGTAGVAGGAAGATGGAGPLQNLQIRCNEVLPLELAPVVDGILEPNVTLLRWLDASTPELPSGMRVDVALAYRPDGVYFFLAVEDPTLDPPPPDALDYCGDGVELYVDDDGVIQAPPAYDSPGTMQFIVAGPTNSTTPAHRGQRFMFPDVPSGDSTDLGDWTSDEFVAVPTATGYAVEAFVVANDLDLDAWALAPGAQIGWNLSFNVGGPQPPGIDACTTRNQQFHFRSASSGACTPPYCNASALCTPTLAVQ
jgi:hypothetical protein